MGIQNQLKISGTLAYAVSSHFALTYFNSIQKFWNISRAVTNNFKFDRIADILGRLTTVKMPSTGQSLQKLWNRESLRKNLLQTGKKPNKTEAQAQ